MQSFINFLNTKIFLLDLQKPSYLLFLGRRNITGEFNNFLAISKPKYGFYILFQVEVFSVLSGEESNYKDFIRMFIDIIG